MLKDRVFQARAVINHQATKNDQGIYMMKASVFRCFLSLIEKDAGLVEDDMGARTVWNGLMLDAFGQRREREEK